MGIFNWVEVPFEIKCECGEPLTDWQSKSGRYGNGMYKVGMGDVNEMHAWCGHCKTMTEYCREDMIDEPIIPTPDTLDNFVKAQRGKIHNMSIKN